MPLISDFVSISGDSLLNCLFVVDLASYLLQRTPSCSRRTSRPPDRSSIESQSKQGENDPGMYFTVCKIFSFEVITSVRAAPPLISNHDCGVYSAHFEDSRYLSKRAFNRFVYSCYLKITAVLLN